MKIYRIEHTISKLGPFQHGLSRKSEKLLVNYWDNIDNVSHKYPPPDQDAIILANKKIPQNLIYKFACISKKQIHEWFGNKAIKSLKKEGFKIVEYKLKVDFDHMIPGTNQCVIFFNKKRKNSNRILFKKHGRQ